MGPVYSRLADRRNRGPPATPDANEVADDLCRYAAKQAIAGSLITVLKRFGNHGQPN